MDFDSDVSAVYRALDSGFGAHALALVREIAGRADSATASSLSDTLLERGLLAQAEALWRERAKTEAFEPADEPALARAAWAIASDHLREHRAAEAVSVLRFALGEVPRNRGLRVNLASALLELEEYGPALEVIDALMSEDDSEPVVNELRGRALYQSGDEELSVPFLQRAFDGGRVVAGLWFVKALCADARIDEAIEEIESMLERFPDRASALLELELREPGSPLQVLIDDERSRALVAPFVGG
jgi:tetratricopeptide (TPR) repeat protein